MSAETNLARLLSALRPDLRPGRYVFATTDVVPDGCRPVVLVSEAEGLTLVIEQSEADRLGLAYESAWAMITLTVHSSLSAVGLTAAVSTWLADAGLSCNVVAGFHHDHLFVPFERGPEAVRLLAALSAQAAAGADINATMVSRSALPGSPHSHS